MKFLTLGLTLKELGGFNFSKFLAYIFYDGTTKRLSDGTSLLVDKTSTHSDIPCLSGGGTLLNGSDQDITVSFASSLYVRYYKDDVLIEDFTADQTSLTLDENSTYRDLICFKIVPTSTQITKMNSNIEEIFAHCNKNDAYTSPNFADIEQTDVAFSSPLNRIGASQINYAESPTTTFDITNYTTSCDIIKQSQGLQLVNFEHDLDNGALVYKPNQINMDGGVYRENPSLAINMTDTELHSEGKFSIEFVIERELIAETTYLLYATYSKKGLAIFTSGSWNDKTISLRLYNEDESITDLAHDVDESITHIVYTVSANEVIMYINKLASSPKSHTFTPSGYNFNIAVSQPQPTAKFPLFKLHKKALTQEEVNTQYEKAMA